MKISIDHEKIPSGSLRDRRMSGMKPKLPAPASTLIKLPTRSAITQCTRGSGLKVLHQFVNYLSNPVAMV